jgi:mRNA interferase RelE/StbE
MYSVEFSSHALDDVSRLDKAVSDRILKKIEWLATHFDAIIPHPLKGRFQGIYKLTVGDWRVFYTVKSTEKVITVHLVGHRSEIYKS